MQKIKTKETDHFLPRWALNNPHMSLHIAPDVRIAISTQRKRNGQPKRPPHSITSILSNLHLLLRVPSFARWPLNVHFFDRDVHRNWTKYCASPGIPPLRSSLAVMTDFGPATSAEAEEQRTDTEESRSQTIKMLLRTGFRESEYAEDDDEGLDKEEEDDIDCAVQGWGIHALPLDYKPLGSYVEKAQNITSFEREGECVVCHQHLEHDKGLHVICSNHECEGVGHLDCWSRHLLHQKGEGDDDGILLPLDGQCPKCRGAVKWADMMKELTLRIRGQKEIGLLLKRRNRAAKAKAKASKAKEKEKALEKARAPGSSRVPASRKALAVGNVPASSSILPKRKVSAKNKGLEKENAKARRC